MLTGDMTYKCSHLCHTGCEDVLLRMDELGGLVLYCLDHFGMAVPSRDNSNPCTKRSVEGLYSREKEYERPI